ncbi:MAG: hypothetical protein AABY15_00565 [Nanoarchaeota archaeon]
MESNKKTVQITKEQLQSIIKEGVERLHRKSLVENRIRQINEELSGMKTNFIFENEVATSEVMEILNNYLEAALWTEEDEIGPANIESDVHNNAKIDSYKDVKLFMSKAGSLLDGLDPAQVGHDLWLTRNGHGAGFWDRGLGEVGDQLTAIAKEMGTKTLYRGDDGQIHID